MTAPLSPGNRTPTTQARSPLNQEAVLEPKPVVPGARTEALDLREQRLLALERLEEEEIVAANLAEAVAYQPAPPLGPEITQVASLHGPPLAALHPQQLATLLDGLRDR